MASEPMISVYKKFLHPRALVSAKYPNASKGDVLEDLLAGGPRGKNCQQATADLRSHASSTDFDDGELLHVVARYCKVQQEGALEHLFNEPQQDDPEGGGAVAVGDEEVGPRELPPIVE